MTTYRAGQRVRINGPEAVVIEATVEEFNGHPRVTIPGMGVIRLDVDGRDRWGSAYGCTVTVLSEPRPDEPQGLGAVVEAYVADWEPRRWLRSFSGHWHTDLAITEVSWSELVDPVVLSEGWQP